MVCKICGGDMIGDGVTTVFHCENVDVGMLDDINSVEPDADPIYCKEEK